MAIIPTPTVPEKKNIEEVSDVDWKKGQDYIKELLEHAMSFQGKEKMNPYAFKEQVIIPLLELPKNQTNLKKILVTPKEEPTTFKFYRNVLTSKTQADIARDRGEI